MRRGGLRPQSQSRQTRRSTLLSQERTGGSGVIGVGPMLLGCCFVKRTLAKLVRLHGACAIVDGAPVFKSIYL